MNARMLIPSKYFTAADFEGETTVTIESVAFSEVEVDGKKGQPATTETKGSLALREFPGKPWLCNVTNTKCLTAMFGEEGVEKTWPGKRVRVFHERVMSFGEWVLGVRIKGSPDLTAPVSVNLKLRKKKAQVLTMQPTAAQGPAAAGPLAPRAAMWRLWQQAHGGKGDAKGFWALIRSATGKADDKHLTDTDVKSFEAAMRSSPDDDAPPPPPIGDEEKAEIERLERAAASGPAA